MLDYTSFPNQDLVPGLKRYFEQGYEPGGFLIAVLTNDLSGAIGQADYRNTQVLKEIMQWVWMEVPSPAWGSFEKVEAWIESKQRLTPEKARYHLIVENKDYIHPDVWALWEKTADG